MNVSNCLDSKSNQIKLLNDLQIVIDIALAVVVCLGASKYIDPLYMGCAVAAGVGIKIILSVLSYKIEDKKSTSSARFLRFLFAVTMLALMILSTLVMINHITPSQYCLYALGIDLSAMFLRLFSKRILGEAKSRYSC